MVKISDKVLLAGSLAVAVSLNGCKKYDDGPSISLLTKTQRLTGDWEVTKFKSSQTLGNNSTNQNSINIEIEIEFDKDGDFDIRTVMNYTYSNYYGNMYTSSYVDNESGEWEFSSNKDEIELDFDDYSILDTEIEITRLTNKELEGEISICQLGGVTFTDVEFEAEKD